MNEEKEAATQILGGKKAFQAKGRADKNGKAETSLGRLRSSQKEEEKGERKRVGVGTGGAGGNRSSRAW